MSDLRAVVGEEFEAPFGARETGLVGTIAYRIDDMDGATVFGPTTAGIIELGTSGYYRAKPNAPGTVGTWLVIWSKDGSFDPTTNAADVLTTVATAAELEEPDLEPLSPSQLASVGPCQAWTTEELVALCADSEDSEADFSSAIVSASQTLYALVPRFSGECGPRRIRPCVSGRCGAFSDIPIEWTGLGWSPLGSMAVDPRPRWEGCGCQSLSKIRLPGVVRSVLEVTIDGEIIPADQYRVERNRWLVRLYDDDGDAARWPACQDDRAEHGEGGTFSVLYTYGVDPPQPAIDAATELACAIYQSRPGATGSSCPLPNGVVRLTRNGVEMEFEPFRSFGYDADRRRWFTGLPHVDRFLNAFNPRGRRRRRSAILSPDVPRTGVWVADADES